MLWFCVGVVGVGGMSSAPTSGDNESAILLPNFYLLGTQGHFRGPMCLCRTLPLEHCPRPTDGPPPEDPTEGTGSSSLWPVLHVLSCVSDLPFHTSVLKGEGLKLDGGWPYVLNPRFNVDLNVVFITMTSLFSCFSWSFIIHLSLAVSGLVPFG